MKRSLVLLFFFLSAISSLLHSQTAPTAEPVYGGYVEDVAAIPLSSTETRLYIATRSANTMFYADISGLSGTPVVSSFHLVPDFSVIANNNLGYICCIDADENSEFVYAALEQGGIYGAGITSGTLSLIDSDVIDALKVYDGYLFYLKYAAGDLRLYIGTINPSNGAVTMQGSIVIVSSPSWYLPRFKPEIHINKNNNKVYVFIPGQPPYIYKTSDTYNSLTSGTAVSAIAVSNLNSSGHEFCSMGIAPDGKIYVSSYEGNSSSYNAWIYSSVNDGDPWTSQTITQDMGRGEFSITGNSSNYVVYYSRIYSADQGYNWDYSMTADGALSGDPNSRGIVYGRSDWGMIYSDVLNNDFEEINDGIQAVEVEHLGMNAGKSIAWIATKSGIWYVDNYDTPTPNWVSHPIWPDYDSMPYVCSISDQTGTRAYLGNVGGMLYRYDVSNGPVEAPSSYQRIFDAASAPSWTWTYGTMVKAIAIDFSSPTERIVAGLYDNEDWDETTPHQGAVFIGENSSGAWTWDNISNSTTLPDGIDVNDLIAVTESGKTVVYVCADYNSSVSPTITGIYRIEETSPGNWSVAQNLYTASGTSLTGTITDIEKDASGTLYACGYNVSGTAPYIVYKTSGSTYWNQTTTSGLPSSVTKINSITNHSGDIYVSCDNDIYELTSGATSWTLYYSYPEGTEINFIYYDDLFVATGYGLFVHLEPNSVDDNIIPETFQLFQNYPNPLPKVSGGNPTTTIQYSIPSVETLQATSPNVQLIIYDVLGREIATLVNKKQSPGKYSVNFNAADLPSGIYFYSLRAGDFLSTKKMVLMK